VLSVVFSLQRVLVNQVQLVFLIGFYGVFIVCFNNKWFSYNCFFSTDKAVDLEVAIGIRARMAALQCVPQILSPGESNNAGCTVDCVDNHQYKSGTCGNTTAVATFPGEVGVGYNCRCSY
jgi:hypothetical protein